MATIRMRDGTEIFYKDWGKGRPIVFSHGWPLDADAWDGQMLFFLQQGYRVVAHDRRGHGRSTQTWESNTMDQFADDLSEVVKQLDLRDFVLVGHSTGGGEVTRYAGRHGTGRISKLVLVSSVTPLMLRSETNSYGTPREIFDGLRRGLCENWAQFYRDLTMEFYGFNRVRHRISEGLREAFSMQGMRGGAKAQYDSIEQFSETDFTADLRKIDVPTLIIHGDDDQIVPIAAAGPMAAKLVPQSQLIIYKDGDHGLVQTHQDRFNHDLLRFIKD